MRKINETSENVEEETSVKSSYLWPSKSSENAPRQAIINKEVNENVKYDN